MSRIFLHGGGDDEVANSATFGRFVSYCDGAGPIVLLVVEVIEQEAKEVGADYVELFTSLRVAPSQLVVLFPTPVDPLRREQLAVHNPSGVFVCGGVTPDYHAALCLDVSWLRVLHENDVPYGGTSAGAAIAGKIAILGGWQAPPHLPDRPIIYAGAGEGLDRLTVAPGLGLVPFAIDVHAGQLGTLTRLIHAVDSGPVIEGWAIDENTQLEVSDSNIQIFGIGHAYHVSSVGQEIRVRIHTADSPSNDVS